MALAALTGGGGDGEIHVFQQPLTEKSTVKRCPLGTLRREGNRWYKYVQFTTGTAAVNVAAGDILFYKSVDGNTVVGDLTDIQANMAAGVAQVALTGGTAAASSNDVNAYIWVQIKGLAAIETDVVAGSAGNALTTVGAADKTLDVSALVTDPIFATLVVATAGAQVIQCDFPW